MYNKTIFSAAALSDYSKQSLSLDINAIEETNAIKSKTAS